VDHKAAVQSGTPCRSSAWLDLVGRWGRSQVASATIMSVLHPHSQVLALATLLLGCRQNTTEPSIRPANGVTALAVASDGSIIAGTGDGLFRSSDDGQSWSHVLSDPPRLVFYGGLATAPGGYVFAATERGLGCFDDPFRCLAEHILFRSPDNGQTWSRFLPSAPSLSLPQTLKATSSPRQEAASSAPRITAPRGPGSPVSKAGFLAPRPSMIRHQVSKRSLSAQATLSGRRLERAVSACGAWRTAPTTSLRFLRAWRGWA
jgi:hypothetical protein